MRENMGLYRGKRTDDGEWVEGYLTYRYRYDQQSRKEILGPVMDVPHDFTLGDTTGKIICSEKVVPETVGECSGERDKHGKLIFEGDIVQHMVNGKLLRGKVEYADGSFGVKITTGGAQFLCFFVDDTCEVIGNIHDNPELLEVSK